jgi:hypothetical protein
VCVCLCVCMYSINGHRAAMLCESHDKHVDSEPQWAHGQYILVVLNVKALKLIQNRLE